MNLGEILDRTFQIYRARFWVFVGIAAIPALAVMGLDLTARICFYNRLIHARILIFYMTLGQLVTTAVLYLFAGFFQYFARPAFIHATIRLIEGKTISIRSSLAVLRIRTRNFLALNLAQLMIILPLPALLFISAAVGLRMIADSYRLGRGDIGFAFLLFFFPIAGILAGYVLWMGSCCAFTFPASVIEGASWSSAFKRSWMLTKGSRIRLMLTLFIIALISWVLNMLFESSIYFLLHLLLRGWRNWHNFLLYHVLYSLSSAVVSTLIGPIYPIAITLFYYDQRIRKEGYDIERMMDAAGMNASVTAPVEAKVVQA
jgi:hypothetical protein